LVKGDKHATGLSNRCILLRPFFSGFKSLKSSEIFTTGVAKDLEVKYYLAVGILVWDKVSLLFANKFIGALA